MRDSTMRHARRLAPCLALLLAACSGGGGGTDCQITTILPQNDPAARPRDRLDLSHWMLILPVDDQGTRTGVARSLQPAALTGGYESEWFFAATGGGVALWAPLNGARTPNSPSPRSELRETIDPQNSDVAWRVSGPARLDATLAVNQVPTGASSLVVGKIVGHQDDSTEYPSLLRMAFNLSRTTCRANLVAMVAEAPLASAPSQAIMLAEGTLQLGQRFSYSVEVAGGQLTVRHGARSQTVAIDPRWAQTPVYFMAGAGLPEAGASANDGGGVTIHALAASH